jgi:hypothetical protein
MKRTGSIQYLLNRGIISILAAIGLGPAAVWAFSAPRMGLALDPDSQVARTAR